MGQGGVAAEGDEGQSATDAPKEEPESMCHACDEEPAPVQIARDPGDPTAEEREDHCVTHIPYRSWCPVCVKAKGRESAHHSIPGERSCKPVVSFDYKTFGQEGDYDDKATVIVSKDDKTKIISSHVCLSKGVSDVWVIERILEDIARLGHTDVMLKGDGEPALMQVLQEVKEQRKQPTTVQGPPAYDPQANGMAEKAVQDYMGQLRTLKIALEARLRCKVESEWEILEWASEWASELINRCQVGRDGRTAYYRLHGRNSTKGLIEFGERVLAKPLRGVKHNRKVSLKDRWIFATWVGLDKRTNEHVVILDDGGAAIRVRTVLRRPKSDRWDADAIRKIKATPRSPNPVDKPASSSQRENHTRSKMEVGEDGTTLADAVNKEDVFRFRDFKITKGILNKYGHTSGCKGCEASECGGNPRAHSDLCRRRIEEVIRRDDVLKARVEMRDVRLDRHVEPEAQVTNPEDQVNDMAASRGEEDEEVNRPIAQDVVEPQQDSSETVDGHDQRDQKRDNAESSEGQSSRDEKRRRLQILASEQRLLRDTAGRLPSGSSRRMFNAMLNALEFPRRDAPSDRRWDVSAIIGALKDDEETPHDETEELERLRAMYEDLLFRRHERAQGVGQGAGDTGAMLGDAVLPQDGSV